MSCASLECRVGAVPRMRVMAVNARERRRWSRSCAMNSPPLTSGGNQRDCRGPTLPGEAGPKVGAWLADATWRRREVAPGGPDVGVGVTAGPPGADGAG